MKGHSSRLSRTALPSPCLRCWAVGAFHARAGASSQPAPPAPVQCTMMVSTPHAICRPPQGQAFRVRPKVGYQAAHALAQPMDACPATRMPSCRSALLPLHSTQPHRTSFRRGLAATSAAQQRCMSAE